MTALILVILVASGEADSPASRSMLRATGETLGLQAEVSIHEIDVSVDDDGALSAGKRWHADAVARVSWQDGHRHATVHLRGETGPRWIDREIGFQATDAEEERGRTIGFAVISMLPEGVVPRAEPPPPPASETSKKQPDPTSPTVTPEDEHDDEKPEPAHDRWRGAVDLAVTGAAGIGGDACGLGGALRGQWFFLPNFSARIGIGARGGTVSAIDATSFSFFGAGGLSWHPAVPSRGRPFGFGGSVDVIAMHEGLSRTGAGGVAESQGRWIPAADLTLEGAFYFIESTAVVIAGGAEMTFGQTDVTLAGKNVDTIPPLRLVAEVAVRVRF